MNCAIALPSMEASFQDEGRQGEPPPNFAGTYARQGRFASEAAGESRGFAAGPGLRSARPRDDDRRAAHQPQNIGCIAG